MIAWLGGNNSFRNNVTLKTECKHRQEWCKSHNQFQASPRNLVEHVNVLLNLNGVIVRETFSHACDKLEERNKHHCKNQTKQPGLLNLRNQTFYSNSDGSNYLNPVYNVFALSAVLTPCFGMFDLPQLHTHQNHRVNECIYC